MLLLLTPKNVVDPNRMHQDVLSLVKLTLNYCGAFCCNVLNFKMNSQIRKIGGKERKFEYSHFFIKKRVIPWFTTI